MDIRYPDINLIKFDSGFIIAYDIIDIAMSNSNI